MFEKLQNIPKDVQIEILIILVISIIAITIIVIIYNLYIKNINLKHKIIKLEEFIDEMEDRERKQELLLVKKDDKIENLNRELRVSNESIITLQKNYDTKLDEIIKLREENTYYKTSLQEQEKAMKEKITLLLNSEEKLKLEFQNLANEIFENSAKKITFQNEESLGKLLSPVQHQLNEFKKRVEDVYIKESKDRSALQQELKQLQELNQKISQEAHNLTNALKNDNKKQGLWGEMVLERVLERSGLRYGEEYEREVSLKDDEGKSFRPDVIVYLPGERHIIIDAKTSLVAYNKYMSTDDEEAKKIFLKNHINSIKEHVKQLSNKRYEDLENINSLDFIFMFIPIEGALLLALENDVNLYDDAFKQKVILVSPTTLLVALRAVENSWRYEHQAKSIKEVYKRAEELYKKFSGFVDDLKKVGSCLQVAQNSYDEAFKKLSEGKGNLINQVTLLKKVSNIKPKKEIDKALVEKANDE